MTGDNAGALRALATSLALLDDRQVSGFVVEAALGLIAMERQLRRSVSLARVFGLERIMPLENGSLDPWTAPDGAWQEILRARPKLACYPLGEVTERATKKTIIELLLAVGVRPGSRRPQALETVRADLIRELRFPHKHRLLQRFLAHFFFELCIDLIRREFPGADVEPAYLYHFLPDGQFRSLRQEHAWRHWLACRCTDWASRFLPHLLEAVTAMSSVRMRRSIRAGLRAIGVHLPRKDGPPDPIFRVVASDRLGDVSGAGDPKDNPFLSLLVLSRRGGNVSVGCDWLRNALRLPTVGDVHPLIRDLVEIGAAVYIAGVQVPRQKHLGRKIDLEFHVRQPKRWNAAARGIERTASILTRDDLTVHFEPKRDEPSDAHVKLPQQGTDRPICLFSGGLDSLAGGVHLLERGERPIFLSHYANSSLASLQKRLIARLREVYGSGCLDHLGAYVAPSKSPSNPMPLRPRQREPMARFLRPFMLLSLACSAALHLGSQRVLICESGPLAIYPLFNEGQIRTRSVDPRFLESFENLIRQVSHVPLCIENPLLYLTKAEALKPFADEKLSDLIAESNSCWHWAQLRTVAARKGLDATGKTHDGKCLPCLIRRTAVHASGLWDSDAGYLTDVFERFGELDQETLLTIADYYRFCSNLRTLSSARALLLAPDFSICSRGVDCDRVLRMFRRSARELHSCLQERGSAELRRTLNL